MNPLRWFILAALMAVLSGCASTGRMDDLSYERAMQKEHNERFNERLNP